VSAALAEWEALAGLDPTTTPPGTDPAAAVAEETAEGAEPVEWEASAVMDGQDPTTTPPGTDPAAVAEATAEATAMEVATEMEGEAEKGPLEESGVLEALGEPDGPDLSQIQRGMDQVEAEVAMEEVTVMEVAAATVEAAETENLEVSVVSEASEALEALAGLDLMVTLHGTDPAVAEEPMEGEMEMEVATATVRAAEMENLEALEVLVVSEALDGLGLTVILPGMDQVE